MSRVAVVSLLMFGSILSIAQSSATAASKANGFQQTIELSRQCSANAWLKDIPFAANGQHYQLAITPVFDVSGAQVGSDVELWRLGDRNANLLEPSGRWHGLQSYNLAAVDFEKGIAQSAFGQVRTIRTKVGITVTIEVLSASVVSVSESQRVFESLRLKLSAEKRA